MSISETQRKIVSTFDEAQEGIELLKQRRAGRVTYLPLERCRPRTPDLRFRLPMRGVVGWAAELIIPRAPWEPALRHLLGDLLVVEGQNGAGRRGVEGEKKLHRRGRVPGFPSQ